MFRYLIPKSKTKATAESVLISVNKSHRCGGKKAFNRLFAFSFRQNLQNNLICCINSNIYRPKVEKVDWNEGVRAVWPDSGIKSSLIFTNVSPKGAKAYFYVIRDDF